MSELARNDQGDEWTAHELRDDYLRTGHLSDRVSANTY